MLAFLVLVLQAVMKSWSINASDAVKKEDTIGGAMLKSLAESGEQGLSGLFMPGIAFAMENGRGSGLFLQEQIAALFPFYGYCGKDIGGEEGEGKTDFRTIMLAEAEEGTYPEAEGTVIENEDSVPPPDLVQDSGQASEESLPQTSMEELLRAENEAAASVQQPAVFIPHTRQNQVDLNVLGSYEALIQQFYTIDANTTAGSDQLNIGKLMEQDMRISKEGDGPQILIYHTHSQEAFADSIPGDAGTSIMGVGEHLAEILRDQYGYDVVHHLGQYDKESRDDSYSVALADIQQVLEDYPSIQVVIDLHRDALPESTHLVMDLDGRPTARFMFFNGLSYSRRNGIIDYLPNPYIQDNLALSLQLKLASEKYYPGVSRKIYLKSLRYNLHLRPRSLLVEAGAQTNTLEEMMNAMEPLAFVLNEVLRGGVVEE